MTTLRRSGSLQYHISKQTMILELNKKEENPKKDKKKTYKSPPHAPTQYSIASSMTTLRGSGSLHMCFSLVLSDEINHCRDMVMDHFVLSFPPDTVDDYFAME